MFVPSRLRRLQCCQRNSLARLTCYANKRLSFQTRVRDKLNKREKLVRKGHWYYECNIKDAARVGFSTNHQASCGAYSTLLRPSAVGVRAQAEQILRLFGGRRCKRS